MNKYLSVVLFLILAATNANAYETGDILIGGQYGYDFESASAMNNYIDRVNVALGSSAEHLPAANSLNAHVGYAISKEWSIFANYTHFSPWVSLGIGNTLLKAQTETNLFTLDTKYSFLPESMVTPYVKFGIGYGHYEIDESANASLTTGSAGSVVIKGAIGGEIELNDVLSLSFEGGYLFAKSATLAAASGATFDPNQLDMSGPFVLLGFDFAIPTSK